MWGYHIRGIWQDVYLVAVPNIHVEDIFVKPLVSKNILELEVTVCNNSNRKEEVYLQGTVREWLNKAGTDINSAPVPSWELGRKVLDIAASKGLAEANKKTTITVEIPIDKGVLEFWTPDHPNLYGLTLSLNKNEATVDRKYERFGWREWTFRGTSQCLNGEPIELKGDSWHFMGVPQMTRRYAWAWFTAIKNMNGNAIRPHAQVYPRFYLDVADEMGICVLNETANWASDGGPKLYSDKFWEASKEHLRRFVLRDRNHASVFGWSISNENKPVILHVYNKPELMPVQKKAWEEWRNIVMEYDPTRPWISADGEDDGDGILPVTVGHYGDISSMKRWGGIGKPWGIGEHSMAYYGTPEQVAKYNGEEAYDSQYGRMKGLANECYHLIANQRNMGASYISVFNMVWYALQPLPLGKKDLSTPPSLDGDGIFFPGYTEGVPGVQPERMGPYCTTLNPGYDPSLPLYAPWPMYDAMRAANAPGKPAWSPYMEVKEIPQSTKDVEPLKSYKEVVFIGKDDSLLKQMMDAQGVRFSAKVTVPRELLYIIDGTEILDSDRKKTVLQNIAKGADIWIWGIVPQTIGEYNTILPLPVVVEKRETSSFIPESKSWMTGLKNSDFYFCEIQKSNASGFGLSGEFVEQGDVLLNACNTDWRKWNKRPEELKTAAVLRSENEAKGAAPTFVKYQNWCSAYYMSTLSEFANSEKGYNTLSVILKNAGIPCSKNGADKNDTFFVRDGQIQFPASARDKFVKEGDGYTLDIWVFSPRPLDDLLIEPNMPKLTLYIDSWESSLLLNGKSFEASQKTNRNSTYNELLLHQGWNKLTLKIGKEDKGRFGASFRCDNNGEFLPKLKVSFRNPDSKK
jgi:beta-galactosidase